MFFIFKVSFLVWFGWVGLEENYKGGFRDLDYSIRLERGLREVERNFGRW